MLALRLSIPRELKDAKEIQILRVKFSNVS